MALKSSKRYHYKCTAKHPHEFWHPNPQKRCIGYHLGVPCQGELKALKN